MNQLVATRLLEKADCSVDIVENGRDAVAAYLRGSYDAIFMDVQMPDMDGLEATQAIRMAEQQVDEAKRTRIPIIALTAHALESDRERCFAAGMDAYIPKPIELPALQRALVATQLLAE